MAQKKDFSKMNTGRTFKTPTGQNVTIDIKKPAPQEATTETAKVYQSLETATTKKGQQGKASPQEAADRAAEYRTQGRKGCKMQRFNAALTPQNYNFIRIMATATGQAKTTFLNSIVTAYREEHPEIMAAAENILTLVNESLKGIPADPDTAENPEK